MPLFLFMLKNNYQTICKTITKVRYTVVKLKQKQQELVTLL